MSKFLRHNQLYRKFDISTYLQDNEGDEEDGKLYLFNEEIEKSALTKGNEEFHKSALTTLFRMKLVALKIYEIVRKNLSDEIQEISIKELPYLIPLNTLTYICISIRAI